MVNGTVALNKEKVSKALVSLTIICKYNFELLA